MASDFSPFERRCIAGVFVLLSGGMGVCTYVAMTTRGWTSTPMSQSMANAAGPSADQSLVRPSVATFAAAPEPLPSRPTVLDEPLSPPARSLVSEIAPSVAAHPAAMPAAVPTTRPATAAVPSDAVSGFTLDCKPPVVNSVVATGPAVAAAPIVTPATRPSQLAVTKMVAPQPAMAQATRMNAGDPPSPLPLRTVPLTVVHVMAGETDSSEWYELKLNPSQAGSLRDALLNLGSVAGADCDESDHLTPNTLPAAAGARWWLPGELTDLDLITVQTGSSASRKLCLALSARTGRAFLYASDAISFATE